MRGNSDLRFPPNAAVKAVSHTASIHRCLDFAQRAKYAGRMICTLLGSGTSHGIPVVACSCPRCLSADPRDRRLRASAYIRHAQDGVATSLLVDVGPDFREQALRAGVAAIDAILLTHSHADHLHGLDDIRVFSHRAAGVSSGGLPVYANRNTVRDVRERFSYIFRETQPGGGKPNIRLLPAEPFTPESPLKIGGIEAVYVPIQHGDLCAAGWVLTVSNADGARRSLAYLTDCNYISPESIDRIRRAVAGSAALGQAADGVLEHVIIDGLRIRPHVTHFSFDEALECAVKIGGAQTWITHICHDVSHADIAAYCAERNPSPDKPVLPAYDGLVLHVGE